MSGLICEGDVYIDREDENGDSTGLKLLGNTTKFEIKESVEKKQRVSRAKANFGTVLDSDFLKNPSELAIGCDEFDGAPLEFALLGDQDDVAVTGGTVSNEDCVVILDAFVELAHEEISSVVVTANGTGPTYTEGTDYEVNADMGWLKALSGGAIADGATVDVDYVYASQSGIQISAGTSTLIKGKVVLDGRNRANGRRIKVTIPRTALGPNAAIDFKSGDFAGIELQGAPELVVGSKTANGASEDAAYYVKYLD